jgi:hypothetical protein
LVYCGRLPVARLKAAAGLLACLPALCVYIVCVCVSIDRGIHTITPCCLLWLILLLLVSFSFPPTHPPNPTQPPTQLQ